MPDVKEDSRPDHVMIKTDSARQQKDRERVFRENSQPHGEFIIQTKTFWWNVIEMENVCRALKMKPGSLLLDSGCADGRFFDYLHSRGKKVCGVGVDFALKPLRLLRAKRYNTEVACGDVCHLPFVANVFERAVSIGTVQQLASLENRQRAEREVLRVLRRGGRAVFTVPNRQPWSDLVANGKEGHLLSSPELYVYLYEQQELRRELTEVGFEVLSVYAINNLPVRYLKVLGIFGFWLDLLITYFFSGLSISKGRYLLAVCRKK